jgi:hypothetical protein
VQILWNIQVIYVNNFQFFNVFSIWDITWFFSCLQLKSDFISLLKDTSDIDRHSRWSDIKRKIDSDPRYKAVDSSSRREDWFKDYVKNLDDVSISPCFVKYLMIRIDIYLGVIPWISIEYVIIMKSNTMFTSVLENTF